MLTSSVIGKFETEGHVRSNLVDLSQLKIDGLLYFLYMHTYYTWKTPKFRIKCLHIRKIIHTIRELNSISQHRGSQCCNFITIELTIKIIVATTSPHYQMQTFVYNYTMFVIIHSEYFRALHKLCLPALKFMQMPQVVLSENCFQNTNFC